MHITHFPGETVPPISDLKYCKNSTCNILWEQQFSDNSDQSRDLSEQLKLREYLFEIF